MSQDIKLIFAADIVPTATNETYFIEGNVEHLFGEEMLKYLTSADFRCFNLEVPLTNKKDQATYPGPYLMAKPECVHALQNLYPSLLTIGNNHALDQGYAGCESTMATLKKAGIPFTGAGHTLEEANKPFIQVINGVKIGIYNCSEYEFAAATEDSCGVNPYDPLVSFDAVRELKSKCDVIVVLYHGGKEFYRYPSPQVQRLCRKFVECGANLVITQHTHCVGCEEKYNNGVIVYGQGNFLLDRKEDEFKRTGVFVELTISADNHTSVAYKPFVKQAECVRMASDVAAEEIMDGFWGRTRDIQQPGFVKEKYRAFAGENLEIYLAKIVNANRAIRILQRLFRGRFFVDYYDEIHALRTLNIVSTDNHSELFKEGLRACAERKRKGKS